MSKDSKYKQFDSLVERNRGLIRRLCWRHSSGSNTLCDELVQDCYVSIWLHLSSLRPDSSTLQKSAWWLGNAEACSRIAGGGKPSMWQTN